ncbi:10946_t:CDS:2, partial [Funneliformis geosporum]
YPEAFQELYRLKPEFNGKPKFLKSKKIFGGERSALATVFFELNTSEVISLIKKNINSKQEFFDIGLKEIIDRISITFFGKEQRIVKILIFKWQRNLISYELYVLEKDIKEIDRVVTKTVIE